MLIVLVLLLCQRHLIYLIPRKEIKRDDKDRKFFHITICHNDKDQLFLKVCGAALDPGTIWILGHRTGSISICWLS